MNCVLVPHVRNTEAENTVPTAVGGEGEKEGEKAAAGGEEDKEGEKAAAGGEEFKEGKKAAAGGEVKEEEESQKVV